MDMITRSITTSDGVCIAYCVFNDKAKNGTIVFLHGLGGCKGAWDDIVEYFVSKDYSCITIDLRGHADSGRGADIKSYHISRLSQDVIEVIRKETIKKGFLVGHCLGGMVAIEVLKKYPDFARAVLINTSLQPPALSKLIHLSPIGWVIRTVVRLVPAWKISTPPNFRTFWDTSDYSVRRILSDIVHTSLPSYFALCLQAGKYDGNKNIYTIKIPCLVLAGGRDTVYPVTLSQNLADHLRNSKLSVINDGNHVMMFSDALSEVKNQIYTFISQENT